MDSENRTKIRVNDLDLYYGEKQALKDINMEIKENEVTAGLMRAETEYGAFVNSVFNIISATIQGNDTSDCGGCCSSCTGCH